jgi:transcription initiation factor TFIIIB Brf1 subunit/transcription initiation factor TFIIB
VLECFFIIYKIAIEEEQSKGKEKAGIVIQEIGEEVKRVEVERSFQEMRGQRLGLEEFF